MSNQSPYPPQQQPGQQAPGWGAPGQQQPAWGAPQQQPPKKSSARKVIGIVVAAVVGIAVIGAIAGSGDSSSEKPKASKQATAEKQPEAKPAEKQAEAPAAKPQAKPEDDVKLSNCQINSATSWPSVAVTITNHSSEESNYMVQVEFVKAGGSRLGEAMAATNNLAPGQTAKKTAQGLEQVSGSITCKVTDVTRYASP